MAIVIFGITLLVVVLLPLAVVVAGLFLSSDIASPDAPGQGEAPTIVNVGRARVLGAIDRGDLEAARRAFLAMTDACGSCSKLYPGAS